MLKSNVKNIYDMEYSIHDPEPVLSFSVISDTHSNADMDSDSNVNFKNALIDLYTINPGSEALCVVGDMTERGKDAEYDTFMNILDSVPHPKTYFVLGNHDVRWQEGGFKEASERFLLKTKTSATFYDEWIKGFHFIFMSTDTDLKDQAYISQDQLRWLERKISVDKDSNKPVFVFLHQSIENTSAGSYPEDGYGFSGYPDGIVDDSNLINILSLNPQCIFITGHTHAVIESPKTVNSVHGFTCVNTSSVSYTISCDGVGEDNESQGICFYIYENKVIIRGRNFSKKQWVQNGQWEITYI